MVRDRTLSAITIRAVEAGNLTDSYQNLGSALTEPVYILMLKNTTDVTVLISEDGTNDHYELPPGASETYDLQANRADGLALKRCGLQFKVKINNGVTPSCGRVILQGQTL